MHRMRWLIGFALLVIASTADAQLFNCATNAFGTPELTATVNGQAPVAVQLQYSGFVPNLTTTPVVSRSGNTINIVSENHRATFPFEPPFECITLSTLVGDLPAGTYTVNWTVLYSFDGCSVAPCPPSTATPLTYTTHFTANQPIVAAAVPTMNGWIGALLAMACVTIALAKLQ